MINFPFMFIILLFLSAPMIGCVEEEVKPHKWRLQSHAIERSIDYQELIVFSKNIEIMSSGRLIITPYPCGTLAHGPDIFNAVKERRVEMGNGWPNWWSAQNPAWAVMNAGPFDFMNLDASMMFFLADEGTRLANTMAEKEGIIWRPA